VIQVDSSTADEINTMLRQGQLVTFHGQIAAGAVDYNRDYYSPDHHVWNWHVVSVDAVLDPNHIDVTCECAPLVAKPSEIGADPNTWIQQNGDAYEPRFFQVAGQMDPFQPDAVGNVSNRGRTGSGEGTLISGFIIQGGQPRNIVIRGLGPSLAAFGIQQFAANPKIQVFSNMWKIAENDDWQADSSASELVKHYPNFVPTDTHEAALLLTLMPGSYTVIGLNQAGADAVELLEVYDVDAAPSPSSSRSAGR
jgi:hypothetical protein